METGETVHARRVTVHRRYDGGVEQYRRRKLNSIVASLDGGDGGVEQSKGVR